MFKKSATKRLEAAKSDLQAAEAKVAQIAAAEDAALETAEAHVAWRRQRDDAAAEIGRLQRLIAIVEIEIAEEDQKAAAAAQAKLESDANAAADRAAELIRKNMNMIEQLVHTTLRAIADADALILRANAGRPEDQPRLPATELRSRVSEDARRVVLSDRVVERWVFVLTGSALSDDQTRSVKSEGKLSFIETEVPGPGPGVSEIRRHPVEKRPFRRVEFLPAQRVRVEPLAEALSIPPLIAGEKPIWSPMRGPTRPAEVIARLDELSGERAAPSRRQPEIEFLPIDAATSAAA